MIFVLWVAKYASNILELLLIMNKILIFLKERHERLKQDNGFSLLELVVAVGILLILTLGGLLAYNGITDNARNAAVQKAANEVYDTAMARHSGGDTGSPTSADDDWNGSAANDNQIATEVSDLNNGRYEVKAWYGDSYDTSEHRFILTTPESGSGGEVSPEPENPGPGGEDDLSFLDNPSQLPAAIVPVGNCTPETEREKSAIFLNESLRRGELYVKWYDDQLTEFGEVDGQEAYKWQSSLAAEFIDTDCGTFTMATQTVNNEFGANYYFGIVLKPSGGGYYKVAENKPEEDYMSDLEFYADEFNLEQI